MPKKILTIAAARLKQDKAWEAVERARADLRAAIRNGIKCTNCKDGLVKLYYSGTNMVIGLVDCENCEGLGALDPPEAV